MRAHEALKAFLAIQSWKTLSASYEAHYIKINRFENSTNLQKNRFDRQNTKTWGISKYLHKRSPFIFHMKHCATLYKAPLSYFFAVLVVDRVEVVYVRTRFFFIDSWTDENGWCWVISLLAASKALPATFVIVLAATEALPAASSQMSLRLFQYASSKRNFIQRPQSFCFQGGNEHFYFHLHSAWIKYEKWVFNTIIKKNPH